MGPNKEKFNKSKKRPINIAETNALFKFLIEIIVIIIKKTKFKFKVFKKLN